MVTAHRGRVLFVTSSFPRWEEDATSPFMLHLAQDLRALGWDVTVLAPHAAGASRSGTVEQVPIRRFRYFWPASAQTLCYGAGGLINLRRERVNVLKLPGFVMAEAGAVLARTMRLRPQLVHSHWLLPQGLVCGIASTLTRVPHVATIHGSDVLGLGGALMRRLQTAALAMARAVTVNSSVTQAAVLKIEPSIQDLTRIPMGAAIPDRVDIARRTAVRTSLRHGHGPLLVFVGRLIEQKGADDLLAALPELVRALPDARLAIVGDGPQRAQLERSATTLGIAERVAFTGHVPPRNVHDYLAAADVFLALPKNVPGGSIEAQGLTVVEAMLAGVPVVATRHGGIVDCVRHGETGLLVAEGAPGEVAAAVLRLLREPALADHVVRNAAALVDREFTRRASAQAFSDLYERVLGRNA